MMIVIYDSHILQYMPLMLKFHIQFIKLYQELSTFIQTFFFKNLRDKEILEQNAYFLLKARPFQGGWENLFTIMKRSSLQLFFKEIDSIAVNIFTVVTNTRAK
jgi:hypothetical protein